SRRRRAMPMLLAGRKPHDIARPDFFDGCTPALREPKAGRDDQRLAERMRMPCGTRTRLEGDARASNSRRLRGIEYRIDAPCSGEILRRSLAGRLRAASFDFHRFPHSLMPQQNL